MKRTVVILVAVLVVVLPGRCFGMMEIEEVTPERAKQLGMVVTAGAAGPAVARVTLAFEVKGELTNYRRVDLEVRDGGKLVLSSTLKEEGTERGRVVVSFAADRGKLGLVTLRVVTEEGPRTRTGLDLRVRDFVEVGK